MADPSYAHAAQALKYAHETGELFWRPRPDSFFIDGHYPAERRAKAWNKRLAGKPALAHLNGDGYLCGHLFNKPVLAHRVVWLLNYGDWPAGQIDHINGIKTDNRLANLRDVSNAENCKNQKLRSTNSSGVTGVYWIVREQRWLASICIDGLVTNLGLFDHFDEAVTVRKAAQVRHGYHPNHGRPG